MSVYDTDNFAGRVKMADAYIRAGRECTRAFDTCFEMYDGAAVAVALVRRARRNPEGALAKNLWKYLGREYTEDTAAKYGLVKTRDLPDLAADLRATAKAESAALMAYMDDVRTHPTYHDGTPRKAWGELGEIERASWIKNPTPRDFVTELTHAGEQDVIPGCERNTDPGKLQLDLFG